MDSQFPADLLTRLESGRIVAVLTVERADDAVVLAEALLSGGVSAMELTLRTGSALQAIERIRSGVPEMLIGAGTVLEPDQVDAVLAAGAVFAVSPGLSPDVVRRAQQRGLPFAPGIMTPTDIEAAVRLGCRELKLFPAEAAGGRTLLRSLQAPYAHLGIRFMPLGGIGPNSLRDWLIHPGVFAVGGSWLAPPDVVRARDWPEITRRAAAARAVADAAGQAGHS